MLKFILSKLNSLFYVKFNQSLNLLVTLYVNVNLFPLREAFKFPILIYGKFHVINLSGKILFDRKIEKGLLVIGKTDPVRSFECASFMNVCGTLHIKGKSEIRRGLHLQINPSATVVLGNNVIIGDNTIIICSKQIVIEKNTRIGNNCTLMDTDFHYIVNTLTYEVKPNAKPILVGKNNWIAGFNVIKKGCKTPTGTIVAGPFSMIGKDYTKQIEEYSIIGGSPAKLICTNYRRINNTKTQTMLIEYYQNHSEIFRFPEDTSLEEVCLPIV